MDSFHLGRITDDQNTNPFSEYFFGGSVGVKVIDNEGLRTLYLTKFI